MPVVREFEIYSIISFSYCVLKKDDEIRNLKERISWRNKVLDMFTKLLAQNNATFRSAFHRSAGGLLFIAENTLFELL